MAKDQSNIKKEYMRERKRVQNLIYKLNKEGYAFNPYDILGGVPETIKYEDINELKVMCSRAEIYQEYEYLLQAEDGEYIPTEYEIAFQNFESLFAEIDPIITQFYLEYTQAVIDEYGLEILMQAIEQAEDEGIELTINGSDVEQIMQEVGEYFLKLAYRFSSGNDDKDMAFQAGIMSLFDRHIENWQSWD